MTAPARKTHQRPRAARREASGVEALAAQLAEMAADMRQLAERVDALDGPQRPPEGFVPLKRAAAVTGLHPETLRLRCVHREVDAVRVGGRWYLDIEKLEPSKPARGGKVAA
jgi:hypothetical protein